MTKYLIPFLGLLMVACSTAPKVDLYNPHSALLSKADMQETIKKRYFSYIHCRNAEVTLLEIQPIISRDGQDLIPVVAETDFQEIKGMSGWLRSRLKALYHFHKEGGQWKVEKIKEVED